MDWWLQQTALRNTLTPNTSLVKLVEAGPSRDNFGNPEAITLQVRCKTVKLRPSVTASVWAWQRFSVNNERELYSRVMKMKC